MVENSVSISVILPAYNARRYIDEALRSVLAQTRADFECLVIDDGSTDDTAVLVGRHAASDSRLRLLRLEHGGIVGALNCAIAAARGPLLARMDADDICLPRRFERQAQFLQEHPECVAAGSWVMLTDPYGCDVQEVHPSVEHEPIEADLLNANGWAMFHPTVMMRRDAVVKAGSYRRQYQWSEDIDLFLRLAEIGRLSNLPEVLLRYRQHFASVNRTRRNLQMHINRQLLDETYRRRGLGPLPGHLPVVYPTMTPFEMARGWCWEAMKRHNWPVARRHAIAAMRHRPFKPDSWKLAYRSLWHD